ncbi:MAG TPA: hypothetical protein PLZ51_12795, partial [Aggregatilineales bacterium]|nr:hypothetical protein [Aggregatilineales bacterium]
LIIYETDQLSCPQYWNRIYPMPNFRAQFIQWLMLPLLLFVWWASFQYFDEMLWYDEYWSYTYAFGNTPT